MDCGIVHVSTTDGGDIVEAFIAGLLAGMAIFGAGIGVVIW